MKAGLGASGLESLHSGMGEDCIKLEAILS